MKKLLLLLLFIPLVSFSQTIINKKGFEFNVTSYETILIFNTTHILHQTEVSGDGYDEIKINKKSTIIDGARVSKGKDAKRLASKRAFWITFLNKYGFELTDSVKTPVTTNGGTVTPGTETLTFTKKK